MKEFPFFSQKSNYDCGPACLKMVLDYYGTKFKYEDILSLANMSDTGISMYELNVTAKILGLKSEGVSLNFSDLFSNIELPCIIHWYKKHYVVLPPQEEPQKSITIINPSTGKQNVTIEEFLEGWSNGSDSNTGNVLAFTKPDGKKKRM